MGNYHVKSGIYHYYRSEFKQAVDFFHKALRDEPSLTETDRRTARYYLTMSFMTSAERLESKGDLESAAEDYLRAIEVSPTYPDVRYRLGRTYERLERPDDAIDQYRQAVSCQSSYVEAQIALAFCLLGAGRDEEAGVEMERALELKIDRIERPFREGARLLGEGQGQHAAEYFHEALVGDPLKFEEHFAAALEELKADNYEAALEHIDVTLRFYPRYPDLHNFRGIALCELGRIEEGIEAFRTAMSLKPDWTVAWLNMAFGLIRAGQIKEAEKELEAILEKDPHDPVASTKLEEIQTGRAPERRRTSTKGAST